jgi:hypothetical protein
MGRPARSAESAELLIGVIDKSADSRLGVLLDSEHKIELVHRSGCRACETFGIGLC